MSTEANTDTLLTRVVDRTDRPADWDQLDRLSLETPTVVTALWDSLRADCALRAAVATRVGLAEAVDLPDDPLVSEDTLVSGDTLVSEDTLARTTATTTERKADTRARASSLQWSSSPRPSYPRPSSPRPSSPQPSSPQPWLGWLAACVIAALWMWTSAGDAEEQNNSVGHEARVHDPAESRDTRPADSASPTATTRDTEHANTAAWPEGPSLPDLVLDAQPAADGEGYELVVVRRVLDRVRVPELYGVGRDEYGQPMTTRVTPALFTPAAQY